MVETPDHIWNERLKSVCGVLYNLASALFAAVAVQVYSDGGVSWQVTLWTGVAMLLIIIPWKLQSLLEKEETS